MKSAAKIADRLRSVGYVPTGRYAVTINGRRRQFTRIDPVPGIGRELSAWELARKMPGAQIIEIKPENASGRFFLVRREK